MIQPAVKYRWANEPRPDRLLVEEKAEGVMRWWDRVLWEYVEVDIGIGAESLATTFKVGQGQVTKPPNYELTIAGTRKVTVGAGTAKRDVYHVVDRWHCQRLRVGLTIQKEAFSSTPHTFELEPERGFEEVFWFQFPGGGKALVEGQGLWPNGEPVDAAWPVRDGQLLQVPMGAHRVAGLPDQLLRVPFIAYVWGYLALHDRWEKL